MILKFAGKVEGDFGKILLSHLQHIVAVGKEHVAALGIECHELVLALLERVEGFLIVTLDPTCLVQVDGFPTALSAILMQQAVLDDLKLQLSNGADDFAVIELVDKHLCHALIH